MFSVAFSPFLFSFLSFQRPVSLAGRVYTWWGRMHDNSEFCVAFSTLVSCFRGAWLSPWRDETREIHILGLQ